MGSERKDLVRDGREHYDRRLEGDMSTVAVNGTYPYPGNSRTASVTEDNATKPALKISTSFGGVGESSPGSSQRPLSVQQTLMALFFLTRAYDA